jgi:hypothetical protein
MNGLFNVLLLIAVAGVVGLIIVAVFRGPSSH